MRALFGLAVPLLLLAVSFTTMVPQAAAEVTYHTISGRVVSDAGEPIAGARINAYSYPEDRMYADDGAIRNADAITDSEGQYSLELPPGKGWVNVYYEKWRQSDGREISVEDDTTVDFTLRTPPPKDAIVEGRVVDANGDPVRGAEVSLQTRCCYAMPVKTEPAVTSDDPAEGSTEPAPPMPSPTAPSATPTTAPSGNGTSASSDGISARPAIMPPYHWDDYATTTTDDDGRFRFEAYAGPRQVHAWAKGYAQSTKDVDAVANETVTVELVLEKVPASDAVVTGRVIDAQTGAPLARAQVNLRSLEWGRYAWSETDADGTFRFTTIPGWAELTVNYYAHHEPMPVDVASDPVAKPLILPAQGPQYYPYTALVKLQSGENDIDAPLVPKPKPTLALIGYVVDPDTKQAVPDARVSVWNHDTGDWGEAVTDATGSYKILVREGHYSGSAHKEGYLGGTQSFRVTGETTQRVDLLMPKGTTKYAPCYGEEDDGCGGPIMYRMAEMSARGDGVSSSSGASAIDEESAKTEGAPAPAPAVAPTMGGMQTLDASTQGTEGADGDRRATFSGEGGGLPPYDPDATQTIPASERTEPGATSVPGPGAVAVLLGALGAAALVATRRKNG